MNNPYASRLYQRNRRLVLAEAGGVCYVPGCRRLATTADHIQPLAHGGGHGLDNLRPACPRHNSEGGAAIANAHREVKKLGHRSRRW